MKFNSFKYIIYKLQPQVIIYKINKISNMSFGGRGGNQYDEMAQMASMNMMMGIMKSCFNDCVADFRSSDLSGNEKSCI
jgi:vancomycin permeability regulator SanA